MKTKVGKMDYFKISDIVSGFHPSSKFYQDSFNNREVINIYNSLLTLHTTEKLLLIDELIGRLKYFASISEIGEGKFSRGYLSAVEDLEDFAKGLKNQICKYYNDPNNLDFNYLSHTSQEKMLERFSEIFMKDE